MISDAARAAYERQFPRDSIYWSVITDALMIESSGDGNEFAEPEGETDEIFFSRLKRSREAGRNLFYEEWPKSEYDPDAIY